MPTPAGPVHYYWSISLPRQRRPSTAGTLLKLPQSYTRADSKKGSRPIVPRSPKVLVVTALDCRTGGFEAFST